MFHVFISFRQITLHQTKNNTIITVRVRPKTKPAYHLHLTRGLWLLRRRSHHPKATTSRKPANPTHHTHLYHHPRKKHQKKHYVVSQ